MQEIDLAAQTLFAELVQRALDAEFDAEYGEKGSFLRKSPRATTTGITSGARATRSATSTWVP